MVQALVWGLEEQLEEQLVLVSSEAIVYFCFAGCTEAASHT